MSRIAEAFAHGKAFIPFLTCADPDLETTEAAVRAMAQAGADLIELGIPFSDPTAEGPVIQAANQRALAGGVTTDQIFDMVRCFNINRIGTFSQRTVGVKIMFRQHGFQLLGQLVARGQKFDVIAFFRVVDGAAAQKRR